MWLPYGQENVHELRKSLKDGCPGVLGNVNLKLADRHASTHSNFCYLKF